MRIVRRSHTAAWMMLVAAVGAMAYFLHDFLAVGALAVLTVIVFNPFYHRLSRLLGGRRRLASTLTVLSAGVLAVAPLVLVAVLSYFQALTILADLQRSHVTPERIVTVIRASVDSLNHFTAKLPDGHTLQLSADQIVDALQTVVPTTSSGLLNFLSQTSGDIIDFFTGLILYVVLLFFLFVHQGEIIAWIKRASPLHDSINNRYLSHMTAAGRSMVLGTFVVGAVQGLLGTVFLTIAGVPYPMFWLVVLTVLSFLPLGGGLVTIPIGIMLLLLGNIWQGLFILGSHFLIVTTIDNILRAFLVSKDAQLPAILTLFAAFAGLKFFGALGVIYGPIIMAVIMTTIQVYDDYSRSGIPLKSAPKRQLG